MHAGHNQGQRSIIGDPNKITNILHHPLVGTFGNLRMDLGMVVFFQTREAPT